MLPKKLRRLDDAAAVIAAARLSARGPREAACRRRRSRHEPRWLESASAFATRVCMEASNQPSHYQAPRSSDPRCPPLPRFRFRLVGSRKIANGCGISHVMSCLIHLITWIYNFNFKSNHHRASSAEFSRLHKPLTPRPGNPSSLKTQARGTAPRPCCAPSSPNSLFSCFPSRPSTSTHTLSSVS